MPDSDNEGYHPHTGKMPSYNENDCFEEYLLQIEFYFEANRIKSDSDKRATLLTCVGKKVFSTLRNLVQPKNLKDTSYDEIIEVLKNHFSPQTSVIMQRFRFYNLKQNAEDISTFVVRIKEQASKCSFGQFLDDAIRDKLVCGLTDHQIQNRLLSEANLDFKKTCEIALAMENASKEARSLKGREDTVLKISNSKMKFKNKTPNDGGKFNRDKNSKSTGKFQGKSINNNFKNCKHCGKKHRDECNLKNATCYKCKRQGHIASVCKTLAANFVDDTLDEMYINTVSVCAAIEHVVPKPYLINILIGTTPVNMQIDSGSAHTIMSRNKFDSLKLGVLKQLEVPTLCSYLGEKLNIVGRFNVPVKFRDKNLHLPLVVIETSDRPTLLGRYWIEQLGLSFNGVNNDQIASVENEIKCLKDEVDISQEGILQYYQSKFPNCFNCDSKGILGEPVNIAMKEDSVPVFCKSRPVPYAIRNLVDEELDSLVKKGVLMPVSHSKWATPIVPVAKTNGEGKKSVRICGDFSITVNKFCETQFYPLPSQEEILTNVGSGRFFSKIDLSMAFHQLPIAPESQELLTLNTPKGLMRYTKLPFGIKSASFLFQQKMDQILKHFPFTDCYIDDLFIRANTKAECKYRTELVLQKLHSFNVKINISKCEFFKDTIKVLGHVKDPEGIHPLKDKCDDISNTPIPTNVTELKSYLGLLGYYQHFIPNLSSKLKPLYKLLEKDTKWDFNKKCIDAFERSRTLLDKHNVLVHYDMTKPIVLQCDSSDYGLGAVLCHELSPGSLRPVFFASKTLNKAERNYAQVHKEALAVIFGIKRFNKYLQGQKFVIETDAKPLLKLLGHDKSVPEMTNSRMQRWALILSSYDYVMKYKKGSDLLLADALSRLPCKDDEPVDKYAHEFVCCFADSEFEDLNNKDIEKASAVDCDVSKAINYTKFGWPQVVPDSLQDYYKVRDELSIENNCLLRANRLVIPTVLREKVLQLLHNEHPGIVRMKHLARGYFWFPKMDKEIENYVNKCIPCQLTRQSAPKVPSNNWPLTGKPFERIHIDYAEYENRNLLIVKDTYSKWIEVALVTNMDSKSTINKLRSIFSTYGLPSEVVSDNAKQFKSDEYMNFFKSNGIIVRNSPPYHPNSNGAAEKSVNVIKNMLNKHKFSNRAYDNFQHRLDCILFAYRNTPSSVTLKTPAELIFKFTPQTKITKLRSDHITREKNYQEYQRSRSAASVRNFDVGESVLVQSTRNKEVKWFPGRIIKIISASTYLVNVYGQIRFVHADHLRKCMFHIPEVPVNPNVPHHASGSSVIATDNNAELSQSASDVMKDDTVSQTPAETVEKEQIQPKTVEKSKTTQDCQEQSNIQPPSKTPRPKRLIKPPNRLNL